MKRDQLDRLVYRARADAATVEAAVWPAQLISIVGTWLAACALFGFVAYELLTSTRMVEPVSVQIIGSGTGMMIAGLVIARRMDRLSLLAHVAMSVLAAGIACVAFVTLESLQASCAAAMWSCLVLLYFLRHSWQQMMLGAIAAGALATWYVLSPGVTLRMLGNGAHLALLFWLCAVVGIRKALVKGKLKLAACAEAAANGWVAVTLIMLTLSVDVSVLEGIAGLRLSLLSLLTNQDSVWSPPLALSAVGMLAYSWPALRRSWMIVVAVAIASLACFVPNLGAALLVLAVCCATARRSMAIAAAFVTVWAIGACYYALQWTLLEKAALFAGAGAAMLFAAWLAWRDHEASATAPGTKWSPQALLAVVPVARPLPPSVLLSLLGLCFGAVLCFVNLSIWQSEQRINHGTQIFVRLAPADPRSLIQGDYMRLRFDLGGIDCGYIGPTPCMIVMERDSKGIAKAVRRILQNETLGEREIVVNLAPQHGVWSMPTDAWYFTEGEAARYSGAQYGEFRVHEGHAMLVGMRGAGLKQL